MTESGGPGKLVLEKFEKEGIDEDELYSIFAEIMLKTGVMYYDLVLIFQANFKNGLSYPLTTTHFTVNY